MQNVQSAMINEFPMTNDRRKKRPPLAGARSPDVGRFRFARLPAEAGVPAHVFSVAQASSPASLRGVLAPRFHAFVRRGRRSNSQARTPAPHTRSMLFPFVPSLGLGLLVAVLGAMACTLQVSAAETLSTNDYAGVDALFTKHCLECHAAVDPEANLVLESFETLMQGSENGPVILPGKSADSLLVKMIEGTVEKEGTKKFMPPGKRKKLEAEETALIKAWIDAGAKPPTEKKVRELAVPKIQPKVAPRRSINALAYAPGPKLIAAARYGEVELRSAESHALVRTLAGHRGSVNALVFSADGQQLFAAAGEAALFGEVRQWNVADGKLIRVIEGHRDALYALALSPDGATLATGSYDQKIKLWRVSTGEEIKTLSGHNGCVFDLAFRPDGKILASGSADRTVKLWDVASGERRDTLSQSLKELYTVAFSPDGKRLVAGGVDNRIRVWEISDTAAETTNPLLEARFAHEGAILKIVYSKDGKTLLTSADDRTVKLWNAPEVKERLLLEKQPDWAPALALALDNKLAVVGRLDGTMQYYDTASGKVAPPPKPELTRVAPQAVQRGVETKLKLEGAHLLNLTQLKLHNPKLSGEILTDPPPVAGEVWVRIKAATDLARGSYELSVEGPGGESGRQKLYVDDVPQMFASELKSGTNQIPSLPVALWGTLNHPGETDELDFEAKAGQTILFDLAAKSLGSKANAVLTLADAEGRVLASNNDFDGGNDPLLAHLFSKDGRYRIRVGDLMLGGSKDHFYRLSIGAFPLVTGCFPLSVATNAESEIELIGYNLPANHTVKVKAEKPGEIDLPIDPEKFRSRRAFKLIAGEGPELVESEPNDQPGQATDIPVPGAICGRIWRPAADLRSADFSPLPSLPGGTNGERTKVRAPLPSTDVDLFRFHAKAGQKWIIETVAAQRGSPIDTRIEVLHADGKPVERLLLQAVRNSAVTFRGVDSNTSDCRVENWEEMELNEWLYLQGEVVKLFRAPQGPDSGFLFYTSAGKRRAYFDTSSTAHALDEPCYIVEPHPPGTKLTANGLPVFTLYYANDDDGERKLGSDSALHFTAPADGAYLIRVTDTRGFSGDRFVYRLVVREPKPDFKVTLSGANPTVSPGSGQSFSVTVDRIDEFDGDIQVDITGLPPGFSASTPLMIQAGHTEAKGTIFAALDTPPPNETNAVLTKVTAKAIVDGKAVTKEVNNLGKIKLGDKPKLWVYLEPYTEAASTNAPRSLAGQPSELAIAPGQTIPAWLRIMRNGHEDLVTFFVENLPHGVIVDNIGLNGVLIPKGENARQIFLNAAKWVPETDRPCYAIEQQAGKQTSAPILLHVRKAGSKVAAATK